MCESECMSVSEMHKSVHMRKQVFSQNLHMWFCIALCVYVCVSVSDCFHKCACMSCHCAKQSIQSRWEGFFAIFLENLSLEDATMPWVCNPIVTSSLSTSACGTSDGDLWISFEHLLIIFIWNLDFFFLMCNVLWQNFPRWVWVLIHFIWYLDNLWIPNSTLKFLCASCFTLASAKCFVESKGGGYLEYFSLLFFLLPQHLEKNFFPLLLWDRHL